MAISFSRPDPASPASVSSAQFPTSRKGYDQSEVRDFLRMVAAEQARLQERERFLERELRAAQQSAAPNMATIDEDTATRLLGEEAARVLTTAREAATQIRQRAEEGSGRLLREATDEAQRLREEAEIEAARRRQDAAADSEAELQMAKQQGRDMVNEARAYRERVLSELARRRELARQQIEQLIHGRDRLLQAFERSRIAAVEVMAELTPLGEPSEYVNLQPTTGPVPIMLASREPVAAPSGHADLTLVPNLPDLDDDRDGTTALSLAALAIAQDSLAAPTTPPAADLVAGSDMANPGRDADDLVVDPDPEVDEVDDAAVADHADDADDADDADAEPEMGDPADGAVADPAVTDSAVADSAVGEPAFADAEAAEPDFFLDDSATPLDETWSPPPVGGVFSLQHVHPELDADSVADMFDGTGDAAAPPAHTAGAAETETAAETVTETEALAESEDDDDNVVELFAANASSCAEPVSTEAATEPVSTEAAADAATRAVADTATEAATDATPGTGGTVDDLFARLRAARSDAVARKVTDAPITNDSAAGRAESISVAPLAAESEDDAVESAMDPESAETPFVDPDETVIPIIVAVARKLKRVLADEQNELLDTLRRKEPVRSIDALLSWEVDQSDRYAVAVEADLVSASVAGANGNDDARNPALVRPATDAVTNEIVAPLRDRLTRCIDKADGDNADLSNQVRSLYREWKTHRIDEHVETIVRLAFDRGALTVTSS
ncbi:MAG: DivIVA domain-containing protein [Ilumatobacteraceae bacterium]